MIAFANIFGKCVQYNIVYLLFICKHSTKVNEKTHAMAVHGFSVSVLSDVLIFCLKSDFLNYLLIAFLLHVKFRSEISVPGLQQSYAELRACILAFVFYNKSFHFIAGEEIFQNHFCLIPAKVVASIRQ